MSIAVEDDTVPARLGPYKVIRRLAKGGMSDLFLGMKTDVFEGPETAVLKVWRTPDNVRSTDTARIRELLTRLIEEGRLGARLRHSAIVSSFGIMRDWDRDLYFLVQEFIHGVTLGDMMDFYSENDLLLPTNIVLQIGIPILKALHYAQFDAVREDGRPLRVVHRDVKPDNVMLGYNGAVKLLDFGVARSTSFTRPVTVGNFVVGTRHYMAPEQVFEPDRVGHRSDLFSVGLLLFEMATMRPLFPRTRALSEYAEALANFKFENYAQRIDIPRYPGLVEILAKALAANPKDRYESAETMAHALNMRLEQAPREPTFLQFMEELRDDIAEAEAAETLGSASAVEPAPVKRDVAESGETPGVEVASDSPKAPPSEEVTPREPRPPGTKLPPLPPRAEHNDPAPATPSETLEIVSLWKNAAPGIGNPIATTPPETIPIPVRKETSAGPGPSAPGPSAPGPSAPGPPPSGPAAPAPARAPSSHRGRPAPAPTPPARSPWAMPVIVFGLLLLAGFAWLTLS